MESDGANYVVMEYDTGKFVGIDKGLYTEYPEAERFDDEDTPQEDLLAEAKALADQMARKLGKTFVVIESYGWAGETTVYMTEEDGLGLQAVSTGKGIEFMNIIPVGSNQTEVELADGTTILYSYKTPVAAFVPGRGGLVTDEFYSNTTSRHINAAIERWGSSKTVVSQDEINELANV